MPELERYMLGLLADLDGKLAQATDDFDFNSYTRLLADFCNEDLSAFYFDIRKDVLYCDLGPAAPLGTDTRRAYRTVLDTLFQALVRYAAPVLVFTAEEVWTTRYPEGGSVHLLEWPEITTSKDRELDLHWQRLRDLRSKSNEAIEPFRREKVIRSSLEATVTVKTDDNGMAKWLEGIEPAALAEVLIVSEVNEHVFTVEGEPLTIEVTRTENHKCGRCWRHLPEVKADGDLCNRCDTVLKSA
jgi:isoleucyl-tRNA synthetase